MNVQSLYNLLRSSCKFFGLKYSEMDKMELSIEGLKVTISYNDETITRLL